MVSRTNARASASRGLPATIPTAPSATVKADSTAPSSRTVVPAMSRQTSTNGPITG